ncbi:hypothetical protein [Paracoccus sp. PAR01]|uniref:hypothetical protein n=1 Tax=Paracoccus sp. PAR01 TaxID=2769282 RepID=UPI001785A4BD|nr:hypothetical protein [Paracoccus sp. PAR01]MBD9528768.1 hypothetical protein [Paracoccus sp. PAR01]
MLFLQILEKNALIFFALLLLALILFYLIGVKIGRIRRKAIGETPDEGATLVVGSVLGLLAFVLALNLAASSSRQDARLAAGLEEVNAIGTAMLQADAVGGPQAEQINARLREYLATRYRFVRAEPHSGEIAETTARTNLLQNEIWQFLEQRVRSEPNDVTSSLMNSLNLAFDASTKMRLMMEYRLPIQLIGLLLFMSLLGSATVGYQFGLTDRKGPLAAIALSVLWCLLVTTIIDIGSGRIWTFRTDTRVYEWQLQGLGMDLPTRSE